MHVVVHVDGKQNSSPTLLVVSATLCFDVLDSLINALPSNGCVSVTALSTLYQYMH